MVDKICTSSGGEECASVSLPWRDRAQLVWWDGRRSVEQLGWGRQRPAGLGNIGRGRGTELDGCRDAHQVPDLLVRSGPRSEAQSVVGLRPLPLLRVLAGSAACAAVYHFQFFLGAVVVEVVVAVARQGGIQQVGAGLTASGTAAALRRVRDGVQGAARPVRGSGAAITVQRVVHIFFQFFCISSLVIRFCSRIVIIIIL